MTPDTVADTLALHELLGLYGHLMDARDWQGLDAVFTDDAVIDFTVFGIELMDGLDAVRTVFEVARHPLAHHVTNIVVELDGDRASVHSKLLGVLDDGTAITGDYLDEAVRTLQGWRLSRRVGVARPRPSRRQGPT